MAFEQVISRAPPGAGAIDAQYATVWRIGAVYWEPLEEPHCVDCRFGKLVWSGVEGDFRFSGVAESAHSRTGCLISSSAFTFWHQA